MSDQPSADNSAELATDRLEQALARIEAGVEARQRPAAAADTAAVKARLDHLIARLRATLAASDDEDAG